VNLTIPNGTGQVVQILDARGTLVKIVQVPADHTTIDMIDEPAGLYIARAMLPDGNMAQARFVIE